MARPDTTQFKNLIGSAHSITVLLPQNPHYDQVASALALKLSLEASGKQVSVVCPDPMTVEFNRLVGIDTLTDTLGGRNLIISFPGQTEYVDKISYNLDKGELQLVITPKPNTPDLDFKKLKFSPSGGSPDLLILVGVDELREMGQILTSNKDSFQPAKMVSLTHDVPRENYTPNQLYDPAASSLSEITAQIIDVLTLPLNTDISSNLLAGLEKATNSFQTPKVTGSTFETAALLMRKGARRHDTLSAEGFPPGSIPNQPYTSSNQAGFGTDSQPQAQPEQAVENKEPPAEWLGPKVYKGPMLP